MKEILRAAIWLVEAIYEGKTTFDEFSPTEKRFVDTVLRISTKHLEKWDEKKEAELDQPEQPKKPWYKFWL